MRLLVTGAGGLLGGRLAAELLALGHDVLAVHRRGAPPRGLRAAAAELLDEPALARLLDEERPDAVVNAAAISRAEGCAERPADAEAVNARLPGAIARSCRARGIGVVAISTDLVFDGEAAPYREEDPALPLSLYGRTKLAGERAVLEAHPGAAVARLALVCGLGHGPRGTSTESVAWSLRAGRPVSLFVDEHRTPIDARSLADAVSRILARGRGGVFHVGGRERVSRYDLGLRVARAFGLDPVLVRPARQADHRGPEARPADVSLDVGRARAELGFEPRGLDEALRESREAPPATSPASGGGTSG